MSYDSLELSRSGGEPVELFRFQMVGLVWRYTSGDKVVTFNGEVYNPENISRDSLEFGSESAINGVSLQLPKDNPVSRLFIEGMPIQPVVLTIIRLHRGAATDAIGLPPSEIVSWDYDDELGKAKVVCASVSQMMERVIPKLGVRRQCAWPLYSAFGCQVSRAAYTEDAVVADIDGSDVTLTMPLLHAEGWFRLGYIETQDGRRLFISSQNGNVMSLMVPPTRDLVVGSQVKVVAGCDRFISTCHSKFNNSLRFMGWRDLPTRNPFIQGV